MKILKRKDFTADANGVLRKRFHIEPKDDNGVVEKIEADSAQYAFSNSAVAEVEKDPDDQTKFDLIFKGAGTGQLTVTGDADLDPGETTTISGVEDFKLEEDEATSIVIVEG